MSLHTQQQQQQLMQQQQQTQQHIHNPQNVNVNMNMTTMSGHQLPQQYNNQYSQAMVMQSGQNMQNIQTPSAIDPSMTGHNIQNMLNVQQQHQQQFQLHQLQQQQNLQQLQIQRINLLNTLTLQNSSTQIHDIRQQYSGIPRIILINNLLDNIDIMDGGLYTQGNVPNTSALNATPTIPTPNLSHRDVAKFLLLIDEINLYTEYDHLLDAILVRFYNDKNLIEGIIPAFFNILVSKNASLGFYLSINCVKKQIQLHISKKQGAASAIQTMAATPHRLFFLREYACVFFQRLTLESLQTTNTSINTMTPTTTANSGTGVNNNANNTTTMVQYIQMIIDTFTLLLQQKVFRETLICPLALNVIDTLRSLNIDGRISETLQKFETTIKGIMYQVMTIYKPKYSLEVPTSTTTQPHHTTMKTRFCDVVYEIDADFFDCREKIACMVKFFRKPNEYYYETDLAPLFAVMLRTKNSMYCDTSRFSGFSGVAGTRKNTDIPDMKISRQFLEYYTADMAGSGGNGSATSSSSNPIKQSGNTGNNNSNNTSSSSATLGAPSANLTSSTTTTTSTKEGRSWDILTWAKVLKPRLDPSFSVLKMFSLFDCAEFFIPDYESFEMLLQLWSYLTETDKEKEKGGAKEQVPFPIHVFLGKWEQRDQQASFLRYAVTLPATIVNFTHAKNVKVMDAIEDMPWMMPGTDVNTTSTTTTATNIANGIVKLQESNPGVLQQHLTAYHAWYTLDVLYSLLHVNGANDLRQENGYQVAQGLLPMVPQGDIKTVALYGNSKSIQATATATTISASTVPTAVAPTPAPTAPVIASVWNQKSAANVVTGVNSSNTNTTAPTTTTNVSIMTFLPTSTPLHSTSPYQMLPWTMLARIPSVFWLPLHLCPELLLVGLLTIYTNSRVVPQGNMGVSATTTATSTTATTSSTYELTHDMKYILEETIECLTNLFIQDVTQLPQVSVGTVSIGSASSVPTGSASFTTKSSASNGNSSSNNSNNNSPTSTTTSAVGTASTTNAANPLQIPQHPNAKYVLQRFWGIQPRYLASFLALRHSLYRSFIKRVVDIIQNIDLCPSGDEDNVTATANVANIQEKDGKEGKEGKKGSIATSTTSTSTSSTVERRDPATTARNMKKILMSFLLFQLPTSQYSGFQLDLAVYATTRGFLNLEMFLPKLLEDPAVDTGVGAVTAATSTTHPSISLSPVYNLLHLILYLKNNTIDQVIRGSGATNISTVDGAGVAANGGSPLNSSFSPMTLEISIIILRFLVQYENIELLLKLNHSGSGINTNSPDQLSLFTYACYCIYKLHFLSTKLYPRIEQLCPVTVGLNLAATQKVGANINTSSPTITTESDILYLQIYKKMKLVIDNEDGGNLNGSNSNEGSVGATQDHYRQLSIDLAHQIEEQVRMYVQKKSSQSQAQFTPQSRMTAVSTQLNGIKLLLQLRYYVFPVQDHQLPDMLQYFEVYNKYYATKPQEIVWFQELIHPNGSNYSKFAEAVTAASNAGNTGVTSTAVSTTGGNSPGSTSQPSPATQAQAQTITFNTLFAIYSNLSSEHSNIFNIVLDVERWDMLTTLLCYMIPQVVNNYYLYAINRANAAAATTGTSTSTPLNVAPEFTLRPCPQPIDMQNIALLTCITLRGHQERMMSLLSSLAFYIQKLGDKSKLPLVGKYYDVLIRLHTLNEQLRQVSAGPNVSNSPITSQLTTQLTSTQQIQAQIVREFPNISAYISFYIFLRHFFQYSVQDQNLFLYIGHPQVSNYLLQLVYIQSFPELVTILHEGAKKWTQQQQQQAAVTAQAQQQKQLLALRYPGQTQGGQQTQANLTPGGQSQTPASAQEYYNALAQQQHPHQHQSFLQQQQLQQYPQQMQQQNARATGQFDIMSPLFKLSPRISAMNFNPATPCEFVIYCVEYANQWLFNIKNSLYVQNGLTAATGANTNTNVLSGGNNPGPTGANTTTGVTTGTTPTSTTTPALTGLAAIAATTVLPDDINRAFESWLKTLDIGVEEKDGLELQLQQQGQGQLQLQYHQQHDKIEKNLIMFADTKDSKEGKYKDKDMKDPKEIHDDLIYNAVSTPTTTATTATTTGSSNSNSNSQPTPLYDEIRNRKALLMADVNYIQGQRLCVGGSGNDNNTAPTATATTPVTLKAFQYYYIGHTLLFEYILPLHDQPLHIIKHVCTKILNFVLGTGLYDLYDFLLRKTYACCHLLWRCLFFCERTGGMTTPGFKKHCALLGVLGTWLGLLTLAQNKPIRSNALDLKVLALLAYERDLVEPVLYFIYTILQHEGKRFIYTANNPWIIQLLGVCKEIATSGSGSNINNTNAPNKEESLGLVKRIFGTVDRPIDSIPPTVYTTELGQRERNLIMEYSNFYYFTNVMMKLGDVSPIDILELKYSLTYKFPMLTAEGTGTGSAGGAAGATTTTATTGTNATTTTAATVTKSSNTQAPTQQQQTVTQQQQAAQQAQYLQMQQIQQIQMQQLHLQQMQQQQAQQQQQAAQLQQPYKAGNVATTGTNVVPSGTNVAALNRLTPYQQQLQAQQQLQTQKGGYNQNQGQGQNQGNMMGQAQGQGQGQGQTTTGDVVHNTNEIITSDNISTGTGIVTNPTTTGTPQYIQIMKLALAYVSRYYNYTVMPTSETLPTKSIPPSSTSIAVTRDSFQSFVLAPKHSIIKSTVTSTTTRQLLDPMLKIFRVNMNTVNAIASVYTGTTISAAMNAINATFTGATNTPHNIAAINTITPSSTGILSTLYTCLVGLITELIELHTPDALYSTRVIREILRLDPRFATITSMKLTVLVSRAREMLSNHILAYCLAENREHIASILRVLVMKSFQQIPNIIEYHSQLFHSFYVDNYDIIIGVVGMWLVKLVEPVLEEELRLEYEVGAINSINGNTGVNRGMIYNSTRPRPRHISESLHSVLQSGYDEKDVYLCNNRIERELPIRTKVGVVVESEKEKDRDRDNVATSTMNTTAILLKSGPTPTSLFRDIAARGTDGIYGNTVDQALKHLEELVSKQIQKMIMQTQEQAQSQTQSQENDSEDILFKSITMHSVLSSNPAIYDQYNNIIPALVTDLSHVTLDTLIPNLENVYISFIYRIFHSFGRLLQTCRDKADMTDAGVDGETVANMDATENVIGVENETKNDKERISDIETKSMKENNVNIDKNRSGVNPQIVDVLVVSVIVQLYSTYITKVSTVHPRKGIQDTIINCLLHPHFKSVSIYGEFFYELVKNRVFTFESILTLLRKITAFDVLIILPLPEIRMKEKNNIMMASRSGNVSTSTSSTPTLPMTLQFIELSNWYSQNIAINTIVFEFVKYLYLCITHRVDCVTYTCDSDNIEDSVLDTYVQVKKVIDDSWRHIVRGDDNSMMSNDDMMNDEHNEEVGSASAISSTSSTSASATFASSTDDDHKNTTVLQMILNMNTINNTIAASNTPVKDVKDVKDITDNTTTSSQPIYLPAHWRSDAIFSTPLLPIHGDLVLFLQNDTLGKLSLVVRRCIDVLQNYMSPLEAQVREMRELRREREAASHALGSANTVNISDDIIRSNAQLEIYEHAFGLYLTLQEMSSYIEKIIHTIQELRQEIVTDTTATTMTTAETHANGTLDAHAPPTRVSLRVGLEKWKLYQLTIQNAILQSPFLQTRYLFNMNDSPSKHTLINGKYNAIQIPTLLNVPFQIFHTTRESVLVMLALQKMSSVAGMNNVTFNEVQKARAIAAVGARGRKSLEITHQQQPQDIDGGDNTSATTTTVPLDVDINTVEFIPIIAKLEKFQDDYDFFNKSASNTVERMAVPQSVPRQIFHNSIASGSIYVYSQFTKNFKIDAQLCIHLSIILSQWSQIYASYAMPYHASNSTASSTGISVAYKHTPIGASGAISGSVSSHGHHSHSKHQNLITAGISSHSTPPTVIENMLNTPTVHTIIHEFFTSSYVHEILSIILAQQYSDAFATFIVKYTLKAVQVKVSAKACSSNNTKAGKVLKTDKTSKHDQDISPLTSSELLFDEDSFIASTEADFGGESRTESDISTNSDSTESSGTSNHPITFDMFSIPSSVPTTEYVAVIDSMITFFLYITRTVSAEWIAQAQTQKLTKNTVDGTINSVAGNNADTDATAAITTSTISTTSYDRIVSFLSCVVSRIVRRVSLEVVLIMDKPEKIEEKSEKNEDNTELQTSISVSTSTTPADPLRPYATLLYRFLTELSVADCVSDNSDLFMMIIGFLGQLSPFYLPSFALHWLYLISHRSVIALLPEYVSIRHHNTQAAQNAQSIQSAQALNLWAVYGASIYIMLRHLSPLMILNKEDIGTGDEERYGETGDTNHTNYTPYIRVQEISNSMKLYQRGVVRLFTILSRDLPNFLSYVAPLFIPYFSMKMYTQFPVLRNIIFSATPRHTPQLPPISMKIVQFEPSVSTTTTTTPTSSVSTLFPVIGEESIIPTTAVPPVVVSTTTTPQLHPNVLVNSTVNSLFIDLTTKPITAIDISLYPYHKNIQQYTQIEEIQRTFLLQIGIAIEQITVANHEYMNWEVDSIGVPCHELYPCLSTSTSIEYHGKMYDISTLWGSSDYSTFLATIKSNQYPKLVLLSDPEITSGGDGVGTTNTGTGSNTTPGSAGFATDAITPTTIELASFLGTNNTLYCSLHVTFSILLYQLCQNVYTSSRQNVKVAYLWTSMISDPILVGYAEYWLQLLENISYQGKVIAVNIMMSYLRSPQIETGITQALIMYIFIMGVMRLENGEMYKNPVNIHQNHQPSGMGVNTLTDITEDISTMSLATISANELDDIDNSNVNSTTDTSKKRKKKKTSSSNTPTSANDGMNSSSNVNVNTPNNTLNYKISTHIIPSKQTIIPDIIPVRPGLLELFELIIHSLVDRMTSCPSPIPWGLLPTLNELARNPRCELYNLEFMRESGAAQRVDDALLAGAKDARNIQ